VENTAWAAAVIVFGLFLIGWGIFQYRRYHLLAKVARVQGVIADIKRGPAGRVSDAYFPVVAFRTLEGADIRTVIQQPRIFSRPKVGTQVTVIYNPAKPATAYIYSPVIRYGGIGYIVAGLCITGLGIAALVAAIQTL
jgi:hypothetical protein